MTDVTSHFGRPQSWYSSGSKTHLSAKRISRQRTYSAFGIEISDLCYADGFTLCCNASSQSIPLYKYHDAPDFLHGNPFVIHGYRGKLPLGLCLRSLLTWNNDSLNIWSHLIGFCVFFTLMVWDGMVLYPKYHGDMASLLVMSLGLLCYQFCMLCSTGYHIFRCHSEKASLHWLALDMTGISVGILGCYLPAIHLGFYCLSVWRDIYLIIISMLFAMVLYWQTKPQFYTARWFRAHLVLSIGLTSFGILPAIHWVYLNGGLESKIVQIFAPKIVVVYLLGFLALFFYLSKFPERWFPGKFDFIGSSHQWWHVLSITIFLWWHHSGLKLLDYRIQHPCFI